MTGVPRGRVNETSVGSHSREFHPPGRGSPRASVRGPSPPRATARHRATRRGKARPPRSRRAPASSPPSRAPSRSPWVDQRKMRATVQVTLEARSDRRRQDGATDGLRHDLAACAGRQLAQRHQGDAPWLALSRVVAARAHVCTSRTPKRCGSLLPSFVQTVRRRRLSHSAGRRRVLCEQRAAKESILLPCSATVCASSGRWSDHFPNDAGPRQPHASSTTLPPSGQEPQEER